MASASITTRKTQSGSRRYVVRFRRGGRYFPVEHGGTFGTLREARIRRDLIAGELAAGRDPREALRALQIVAGAPRTFASWAEAYRSSRLDIGDETRKNTASHLKRLLPTFGDRNPESITPSDVQDWIGAQDLKPSSLSRYLNTLRQVIDFAGTDPNPARDKRVRLPKIETAIVEPPTAAQVEAILAHSPPRWRLPLRVLEQTGMRVGELSALEWRDVDLAESRFRIRQGKTATARRWVNVPEWLLSEISDTCPPDDRTPERRVFQGFSPDVAKNVMARACKAAGIPHFHPHDLRHRYASVKLREGVPVTDLSAQLGHSKKSLTLDVYSHVLIDE
jgi:integrase